MMQCVVTVLIVLCGFVNFSHAKENICPGGKASCPGDSTCCVLNNGSFGCCPIQNAVCCGDSVHCCPDGYTCDVTNDICKLGRKSMPLLKKIPSKPIKIITCPDGRKCLDGKTCCLKKSGKYGCCPTLDAVCCLDGVHCCPAGFVCGPDACYARIAMFQKVPSTMKRAFDSLSDDPVSPDKKYHCQKEITLCKFPSGAYGLCPLENAVCCNDQKHCCPGGYTCDVEAGKRNKTCTAEDINSMENIPAIKTSIHASLGYIHCPDGSCLDNETCCYSAYRHFGCCPYSKAVCCSDHEHCCPAGFRCDLTAKMCVAGNVRLPMLKKAKSLRQPKTQQVNLDEKIHFVPVHAHDVDPVTDDD